MFVLRATNPISVKNKKAVIATPRSVDDIGDDAAELWETSMDYRDRHVVVTGGTGALGSAVVAALVEAGAVCHVPFIHAAEADRFVLRDHAQEYSLPLWGGYGAMYQSVVSIKKGDREATESSLSFSSLTTQIELVDALVQAGRISEGLAAVEAGLELSDGAWATPELQRLKGELLLLQNGAVNAEPAADLFGQALSGARAQEALSWELRAATSLARLLRNQGRPAEAIACLQPVYDRFTEGFDTADLRTAKAILDDLR